MHFTFENEDQEPQQDLSLATLDGNPIAEAVMPQHIKRLIASAILDGCDCRSSHRVRLIKGLIAGAGIDIREFAARFSDCTRPEDADKMTMHLNAWILKHCPGHPLGYLKIIHVESAEKAAGISKNSKFSAEIAAFKRNANKYCHKDNEKWFNWLSSSNATHSCTWESRGRIAEDLAEAIEQGFDIIVLQRLS